MRKFQHKEIDAEGMQTLDAISSANKFNQWMFKTIAPHCHGKILEIGSGIGNISRYFFENGFNIELSDIRQNYKELLLEQFRPYNALVHNIDISDQNFDTLYAGILGSYDTVFSLNVIEHIENDSVAIANCRKLLKPNSTLISLVPAYELLYNGFDKGLEHYRRYTVKSLSTVLLKNGFDISHTQYFNFMGIFGWFISGNILRKKVIPNSQMSFYNKLVPLFKKIDKITFNTIGLSVIVVARKDEEAR